MSTLSDLIKVPKVSDVRASFFSTLTRLGFPVASWNETSIPRATVEFVSSLLVDGLQNVSNIAMMGVLTYANDAALDLHASNFGEVRNPAVASERQVVLSNGLSMNRDWAAGTFVVTSKKNKAVYRNVSAFTVPANGSVNVVIRNDVAGFDSNLPTSLTISTPVSSLTMNPASNFLVNGQDAEPDNLLRIRLMEKWSTLSNSGPTDAYKAWARAGSKEVTKVSVLPNSQASGTSSSTPAVIVYVSSASGTLTDEAITSARANVLLHAPLGVRVALEPATKKYIVITGSIKVQAGFRESAETAITSNLLRYFESVPMDEDIYHSKILGLIGNVPGVVQALVLKGEDGHALTSDGKWTVAKNEVAVLRNYIQYEII